MRIKKRKAFTVCRRCLLLSAGEEVMWEFALRGLSDEELINDLIKALKEKDNEAVREYHKEWGRRYSKPAQTQYDLWRKKERPVYSRFWRAVHNLVAHPLLVLYRPLGLKVHEYTSTKMYKDNGKPPINIEAN